MIIKTMTGLVTKALAALAALIMLLVVPAPGDYAQRLDDAGVYKNTLATALPMTYAADMVNEHFRAPLPAGKSVKKALIIGLDGARADTVPLVMNDKDSAFGQLAREGGLYVALAGGDGELKHIQSTKTSPGWASILTGEWANRHFVWYNGFIKPPAPFTFLTSLVEDGSAASSSFNCLWVWHVQELVGTYRPEATYTKLKGLDVGWHTYASQDDMQAALVAQLADLQGPDIVFNIYERPDETGHGYGFSNDVPEYVNAMRLCDRDAYALIQTIQTRATYAAEDWLILMTSDHGGQGTDHGNLSEDCRVIFIASNKSIARYE